jgi:hypothetical protein
MGDSNFAFVTSLASSSDQLVVIHLILPLHSLLFSTCLGTGSQEMLPGFGANSFFTTPEIKPEPEVLSEDEEPIVRPVKKAKQSTPKKIKPEPDFSEDESDKNGSLKPGQLAGPSKSNVYRRAVDAMKAGVSPQERDMRNILKYMGGEYTTNFKRKFSTFEKQKTKTSKKSKVKQEEYLASPSEVDDKSSEVSMHP